MDGALEYMAMAVAYSFLAAAIVELLLLVWKVQDPPLDIAFRLQVLAIPPIAPPLFALLTPGEPPARFPQAAALLDLRNWLGSAPSPVHPLWVLLVMVMAATAALEAVAFLRWMRAGRSGGPRWHSDSFGRLNEAAGRLGSRGIHLPPVRVVAHLGPAAYTVGLVKPSILVSSAMVDLLDDEELEAVLAHERVHVERQDNWLGWVTFALRILSFYNPMAQFTYHQMEHDIEKVCDTRAGETTGRSLALASALIKVYRSTKVAPTGHRGWTGALSTQAIALENRARRTLVEDRVERLVHPGEIQGTSYPRFRLVLSGLTIVGLAYLVV